ncbi:MAG: T9SS type A sorting domain-containing protein, partial [Bacteroidota bacterium]
DGHGNISTQNQTVIVHDITAPVPNVASLPNITGQCSAAVTIAPKATDNCAGQITGTTSNPLTYNAEGTYTIHWSYNDGHGNISTQNQTVIVHDATAPVISGCPGNINSCISVVSWTPPTASDNCSLQSFTHNHNPGETFPNGTTVVTYTANDGHGNISTCSFNVVVSPSSSFMVTIAASATSVCQGSAVTLTASGANTYSWNNGVVNGVAFVPAATATYTVVGTNAGGCTKSASITITVNGAPAVPGGCDSYKCGSGTVKLTATVGSGETADWYSSATGGTLLASGTLNYNTPNISTTTIYYAQARKTATGCVSQGRKALTAFVSLGAPSNPGPISGPAYGLCNVSGINYSIAPVAGVLYYYWFVPPGATITAGQATTQITVSFGTPSTCFDDIYIFAVNACGISYNSLHISGTTAIPGAISGAENGVCSTNGVNYSITPVFGAVSYTWTVPYGATIVGAGSNTFTTTAASINVNYGSNFSGSGNVCVKTNNGCGSSSTSCKQVNAKPDMPSAITGSSSVCAHANVVYQVSPLVAGATSYNWTVPNGASVTAGQGTSQATVHFGTSSGNVSVKAVNGCGYSNYKSKAVTISCREAESLTTISSFTAYPNPAHNLLTIKIDSQLKGDYQVVLMDITGRLVISENKNIEEGMNTLEIDLGKLPSAVYMLEVKSSVEKWNRRVVKE